MDWYQFVGIGLAPIAGRFLPTVVKKINDADRWIAVSFPLLRLTHDRRSPETDHRKLLTYQPAESTWILTKDEPGQSL